MDQDIASLDKRYKASVDKYAAQMRGKLLVNIDKGLWDGCPIGALIRHLGQEVNELEKAVGDCRPLNEIQAEAADVGNLAMMISENAKEYLEEHNPPARVLPSAPSRPVKDA